MVKTRSAPIKQLIIRRSIPAVLPRVPAEPERSEHTERPPLRRDVVLHLKSPGGPNTSEPSVTSER